MPSKGTRSAGLVARAERMVDAAPGVVWDTLADLNRWPSWMPDVRRVSWSGAVAPGTVFRWRAGSARLVSRFVEVERPRVLAWTGRTAGIRARHVWEFEPRGQGTAARAEEAWSGLVSRVLRPLLRRPLEQAVVGGLEALAAEAERRAAAP